jgi:hypothetical protein
MFTDWSVVIEKNHYKYRLNTKINNKNNEHVINCILGMKCMYIHSASKKFPHYVRS